MKILQILTNYGAGQLPELCRSNKKAIAKAIEDALKIGQLHHDTTTEDAYEIVWKTYRTGEPVGEHREQVLHARNVPAEVMYHLSNRDCLSVKVLYAGAKKIEVYIAPRDV